MSDYISREALVDRLNKNLSACNPGTFSEMCYADAIETVKHFPAADVAPVVPCKGCEHAERYERIDGTVGYYCGHPQNTFVYGERWDRVFKPVKKPDDFCNYGERRTPDGKE